MNQLTQQNATGGHRGDDVATLLAEAETLCRAVATCDLEGLPLYIVSSAQLPNDTGGASICSGYTTPSLDLYLKDHIPSYRGRGPCMVVDPPCGDFLPEDVEHFTRATALHELAHILDRPELFADRTDVAPEKLKFESLVVGRAVAATAPGLVLPPYFGHGIEFIRICLHLRYRAERAGDSIPANNLCAGWQYGLSHASAYECALGDEPAHMADVAFRNILATPMPRPFRERWLNDIRD